MPGDVIVRFRPGAQQRGQAAAAIGALDAKREPLALERTKLLQLPLGTGVREAIRELQSRRGVDYAHPNWRKLTAKVR